MSVDTTRFFNSLINHMLDIMTDFDKNIKQESGEFYDSGVQDIH